MLRGLIFDVDGTLALTEETHRQTFNEVFSEMEMGFQWDPGLYARLLTISGGKERITAYLRQFAPETLTKGGKSLVQEIHRRKTSLFQDRVASGEVPLRPGVARLLGEAWQAGLKVGIASAAHHGNLEVLLQKNLGHGVLEKIDVICSGNSVARKKPAPDSYLQALDGLNLPASDCLAIEDAAEGVQAARSAGIKVVVTANDFTAHHDFGGAVAVTDGLGEPDAPARLVSGDGPEEVLVNLSCLTSWHGKPKCKA
ncbi:MAG: HAD-IA family hydrolase [Magnetospiraceae bacterium]